MIVLLLASKTIVLDLFSAHHELVDSDINLKFPPFAMPAMPRKTSVTLELFYIIEFQFCIRLD